MTKQYFGSSIFEIIEAAHRRSIDQNLGVFVWKKNVKYPLLLEFVIALKSQVTIRKKSIKYLLVFWQNICAYTSKIYGEYLHQSKYFLDSSHLILFSKIYSGREGWAELSNVQEIAIGFFIVRTKDFYKSAGW